MGSTAYAQLQIPQVAATFAHLGFPAYFPVELAWAKLAGPRMVVLLTLTPADGGTHLRMGQSGIPDKRGKLWANCSWQEYLGGLDAVLSGLG